MKKFKKFLLVILLFALAFAVGCKKPAKDETPKELQDAIDYVDSLYKDKAAETAADWTVVGKAAGLDVEWTVTVTKGQATDVVLTANAEGTQYTVDVNEKSETEIAYTLKATVTKDGKTLTKEYSFTVPAVQVQDLTYAQFVAAEKGAEIVVKGVVTAVIGKANGNSANALYFQDADGGYYAYGLSTDPSAEGENQVKPGMTVRVTGTKDIYSGTLEVAKCSYEILDKTIKAAAPADYTAVFAAAKTLKDEALVGKQSILVKIDGTILSEEDDSVASGYYKFKLGDLESYARLSSSTCPLTAAQKETFKANHKAGFEATVTGIVCVYDGAFYLTPVDENCFSNLKEHVLTDAEVVAAEKAALLAPATEIEEAGEIDLPTAGATYAERVAITWASDNACAVVAEDSSKVTFTLPAEDATVTLTATLTAGDVSETVTFEITVKAAEIEETPVESAFTQDKYDGELEKLAKEFVADYNANGGANIADIASLDTDRLESQTMVDFGAKEEMIEKWYWLFSALTKLSGDDTHDPADNTFEMAEHKGFYLANINGFFTKTQHTDTWLAYEGMDFSDPANFNFVMDSYLYGNLVKRLADDFVAEVNAKFELELEGPEQIDTLYLESDYILTFFADETLGAKWGWLKDALAEVGAQAEPSKGFLLANICGLFTMDTHTDTWLEVDSMDFTNLNKVRAVLNVYINAHPEENDVDLEPETATDVLIVNPAWADKEEGAKVNFGKKAYLIGTNAFASLDAALAVAEEGATIRLAAGEYPTVTLDKANLTLEGPNAGQNPNLGSRADEAIFKSDIVLAANGITVKGIYLTEAGRIKAGEGDLEDLTIDSVLVWGCTLNEGNKNATTQLDFVASAGNTIKNVTLKNSRIENNPDIVSDRPMIMVFADVENLTIIDNVFLGKQVNYNDGIKIITDNAAFGIKGEVLIKDNYFAHYQQYVIWMRAYGAGTYNIINNTFTDCGLTTASHGMATFVTYKGTTTDELTINMCYNTMESSMILLRIDAATLPENAVLKANYNVITEHKGDFYIKNANASNPVDGSYGYWAGNIVADKFMNATYENAYDEPSQVPAVGDADEAANTYTVTYDLAGGEWLAEGDESYVYGHELFTGLAMKDGYELAYWVDENGQKFESFPITLHQNLTLKAVWVAAE